MANGLPDGLASRGTPNTGIVALFARDWLQEKLEHPFGYLFLGLKPGRAKLLSNDCWFMDLIIA